MFVHTTKLANGSPSACTFSKLDYMTMYCEPCSLLAEAQAGMQRIQLPFSNTLVSPTYPRVSTSLFSKRSTTPFPKQIVKHNFIPNLKLPSVYALIRRVTPFVDHAEQLAFSALIWKNLIVVSCTISGPFGMMHKQSHSSLCINSSAQTFDRCIAKVPIDKATDARVLAPGYQSIEIPLVDVGGKTRASPQGIHRKIWVIGLLLQSLLLRLLSSVPLY
ncbi:hypothetical protein Tco_0849278 [Tanacetum coccineum]